MGCSHARMLATDTRARRSTMIPQHTAADDAVPAVKAIRLFKSLRRVDIVFFIVAVVIRFDAITAL
jgi:hypothetical protein